MEQIIKRAIEGGYENYECACEATESNPEGVCKNMRSGLPCASLKELTLDPLFWQALGRACGWGKDILSKEDICFHCGVNYQYQPPKESGCNHVHYPEACSHCSKQQLDWLDCGKEFHRLNLQYGWDKAVAYLQEVTK